jgi:hypothetical protein
MRTFTVGSDTDTLRVGELASTAASGSNLEQEVVLDGVVARTNAGAADEGSGNN